MTTSLGVLLVVDDEEMNRDLLVRRLELENYASLTASCGREALQLIAEHQFDAVLLDTMMPGQNGYEVLAEIRKTHSSLELPVLMVTAKNQSEDVVNAFELGANDYITKPINFPVAMARINCHVASKKLSRELRESETRYSLSAKGVNDGLWDWNLSTDRIYYSDRWKSMLGYAPDEVGDDPQEWFSRIHPEDLPHVRRLLEAHRQGHTPQFECEYRMVHKDQSYRWVLTRGMATRDASGRESRMAGSQTDITRGKAADPLTGLPNRVLFMDHLNAALRNASQQNGGLHAVLFLDLDRFKIVNDSLGHMAGDELLVAVAKRLESCMRASDVITRVTDRCTISRFGGDEFVVLLKGLTHLEDATRVADRVLQSLSEPLMLRGQEVRISASIGIAVSNSLGQSADDLLRDADTAMYQAKSNGKTRWCLFDDQMRTMAVERFALEADLKRGLDRGEFQIHYQPIVELPSGEIIGLEALLRWNHPVRGSVPPQDFIPIAEEIGYIVELGAWVLDQACQQVRTWQLAHPDHANLFVSVNVSTRQFADAQLFHRVKECLQKTGLQGCFLKLEITESAIMFDPLVASRTIDDLRALGVQISLDDFGVGYSSLSYLQQFKIDTLKIDRSFISRMSETGGSSEIVRTIVNLAHLLGMKVTAEGIEDEHQHVTLQTFDCESGQGYLYSQPIPGSRVDELLRRSPLAKARPGTGPSAILDDILEQQAEDEQNQSSRMLILTRS